MNFIVALLIPAISALMVNGLVPPASLDTRGDVLPRCTLECEPGCGLTAPPACSCKC
ncbi:hypothetical protein B0H19DRAFT_1275478 [Mycena capillaripes]|nr:hypothetical protein B0H19DRAFT_1275478 [Mycena capillaripes]